MYTFEKNATVQISVTECVLISLFFLAIHLFIDHNLRPSDEDVAAGIDLSVDVGDELC